ncbi:MAG TPA: zf-HC2 domain-containing protein [Gemmatimonadaceae bacterium]|nr:zf-HC2 domain-containing protein [Gemmatimonadaceae bacterium]
MTMPLDCDEFAVKLADYLDGDLPDAVRGAVDAHASRCAECARLLSEIEALRVEAASLPLLEPSRDLWTGIAERIDARVLPLESPRVARVAAIRRTWRHPAIAAAALVLVTAGITHVWTRVFYTTPVTVTASVPVATPSQTVAVNPVVVEPSAPDADDRTSEGRREATAPRAAHGAERPTPRLAAGGGAAQPTARLVSRNANGIMKAEVEPVYDREILKLRAIVRERRSQLDPKTVAVLEQSIAVIDSAIAQSRAALAKDPASGFLATQLNHSLEKKVELLRTAALLPART